ncbi:MAG: ATP-binding protein [Gammaproteobacteria bacterium]|nr:ATP-binding protein [Gammaproteobacteria bacterium]MDH5799643.1 ATP-binding protein [Gammaproteobacteria bacterium]
MIYNFNPFGTDFDSLVASQLEVLREVKEGWYMDYKSDLIAIKKIAKSISSFANQYGGWLVFGVRESDEKCAGEFVGIEKTKVNELSERIREAVRAHVNPAPFYLEKVFAGPVKELGLINGRSILLLYIPEGVNPPYIHSSGVIYRRIADQSDPKPEADRGVLDGLWNKAQTSKNLLKKFLRSYSKPVDTNSPVAFIYLVTNPRFDKVFGKIDFRDFLDIMSGKKSNSIAMPMKTVHSVSGGYVARHTHFNEPQRALPSIQWWHSGNALITLPISTYDGVNESLENLGPFFEELKSQRFSNPVVSDFTEFYFSLAAMYNQLIQVKESTKNREDVYVYTVLENTRRLIPYIDDPKYIEKVKKLGVPMVETSTVTVPDQYGGSDTLLYKLVPHKDENPLVNVLREISLPFTGVLGSVGILNGKNDIRDYKVLYDIDRLQKTRG